MDEEVTISKDKLNVLRRSLKDALDFIESIGVSDFQGPKDREEKTPDLTPKEQRINKYLNQLK